MSWIVLLYWKKKSRNYNANMLLWLKKKAFYLEGKMTEEDRGQNGPSQALRGTFGSPLVNI